MLGMTKAADKNPRSKIVCIFLIPTAKPTYEGKHYFSNSNRQRPAWALWPFPNPSKCKSKCKFIIFKFDLKALPF